ncbi:MAG: mechanosensitive ion channel family protein [Alcaligenaceae bacterium]|nr:mechanosensitive ion channel family protein [Alcaligenaceae bacterium]
MSSFFLRLCFVLKLSVLVLAGPVFANELSWTGDWDSTWRDRGARISLVQEGDQVTGGYKLYGGQVVAQVNGHELRGVWKERGRDGTFYAVMSDDGQTFTARFGTGEWITGIRVEADNAFMGVALDRSSPANVMYHFLSIMNAVGPGRMELLSEASHFIDFSRLDPSSVISELEYTQLLFSVLDRLTFRVWGIQARPGQTEMTVKLPQAGTDSSFELGFVLNDKDWWLVPPSPATLRQAKADLSLHRDIRMASDDADLSSPRATVRNLFKAFSTQNIVLEHALATLNMSEMSALAQQYEGPRLARYVYRALLRLGSPVWQEIPDDPARRQVYTFFEHPYGVIALEPVETDYGLRWQFTPETLLNIRAVYAALDNMPVVDSLAFQAANESLYFKIRDAVRGLSGEMVRRVGAMEVWQWLGLLFVFVMAVGLGRPLTAVLYGAVINRLQPSGEQVPAVRWLFLWSFRLLLLGVILRLSDKVLSYPDIVQVALVATSMTAIILSTMLLLLLATGFVVQRLKAASSVQKHVTLVAFIAGIFRMVVVVSALLLLADVLQMPYQSVLAGLGLGGLAVALAAQSTLQNFISGITLYFDKPIAVGDYCKFGEKTGTVEFIGMRSTRIRTLDRTIVTIPNSEFSNMQIENYAKRDSMFLNYVLRLRYETTPDQMRYVLAELRKLLLSHPKVASDPLRVRFDGFGEHALEVSVFAYVMSCDYAEFVAIREDIHLRVMDVVERSGSKLAVPSMLHYNTEDRMPDQAKVRDSEAAVAQWREDGVLPFPDYDWPDKAAFRETLEYPPEGSVLGSRHT